MFTNILTLGQVLRLVQSESCMHMGLCAKGRFGARANKAILYRIVDRLQKSNELYTMSFVLSTFHIALMQDPYGPWPRERALAPRALRQNFRGKVAFPKSHVLVHIELRGAIVELAQKSKMG